jgi:hypothetical protein
MLAFDGAIFELERAQEKRAVGLNKTARIESRFYSQRL